MTLLHDLLPHDIGVALLRDAGADEAEDGLGEVERLAVALEEPLAWPVLREGTS